MKIVLKRFGKIPPQSEQMILQIIKECYRRLQPHGVVLLDLLLFTNPLELNIFFSRERRQLNVVSDDFSSQFFALHDAWRGLPRISICLEALEKKPKLIQQGAIRHEGAHSVLHGSPEFYLFPPPLALQKASQKWGLSKEYCTNLIYLASIAVKDFEVTQLLVKKGYVSDQVAYAESVVTTSEDDLSVWRLSERNPAAMGLALMGRLKDLVGFSVLGTTLGDVKVNHRIEAELWYLPELIRNQMLTFIQHIPPEMGSNTHQNVTTLLTQYITDMLTLLFKNP